MVIWKDWFTLKQISSFATSFTRFFNKLCCRSNLYLLEFLAKMLKSSKFMAQLNCNSWSDCLTVLRCFSCKIGDPHVFRYSVIKVVEGYSIISNLAVTTCITINYSRTNIFLKWFFNRNSVKSALRPKNYFQFIIG